MIRIIKNILGNKNFQNIVFILLLSLTPLLWFKDGVIMVGHDNVYPLNPPVFFEGRLHTWIDQGFGRSQSLIMGTIPIHLVDALPSLIGFSVQDGQKLVYVFWFFMMGFSAYILASVINPQNRYFKIIVSLFYQYNFFILQAWFIGERTKFSAYIALPLVLAVFIKVYRGDWRVIKGVVINSLILLIFNGGGLYGIPLYGGFFLSLFIFVVVFSILGYFKNNFAAIKRLVFLVILSVMGYFLINAYYILPSISEIVPQYLSGVGKSGGSSGFIDWASEISANASYSNLLRFEGIADWYDNPEHPYAKYYFSNPLLILISFLWVVFILFSIIKHERGEKANLITFFFLTFLLGIFFSAGTHPPLGFIYKLILEYIPGFIAFRSPYFKFAPAIFFASSFLIGYFLDYFQGRLRKAIFVFLIVLLLLYHFPYFTGNFFNWRTGFTTRNNIPEYVLEFTNWLEKNSSEEQRTLLLPPTNKSWQYDIYKWGYLSFQALPGLATNKGIILNDDKLNSAEEELVNLLYLAIEDGNPELIGKFTSLLRVKYLVVRHDFVSNLDWAPSTNPSIYQEIMDIKLNTMPIKRFGEWDVYELRFSSLPVIFTTSNFSKVNDSHIDQYFYDFSQKDSQFLMKTSYVSTLPIPDEMFSEYIVPSCLNCRHELGLPINLPDLKILPDSSLYPLILLNEKKEYKNKSKKELVYADLGLTLKRLSEIRKTVFEKSGANNIFDRYVVLLQQLNAHFKDLTEYRDSFETAEDINYYLQGERRLLYGVLGASGFAGGQSGKIDEVFNAISSIEKTIDPYLFKPDKARNRLLQFTTEKAGFYKIYLKKEDVGLLLKDKPKITVEIDGVSVGNFELSQNLFKNNWFFLENVYLSKGTHKMIVSLPELPNYVSNFKEEKNLINYNSDVRCYSSNLTSFDNKRTYKVSLDYLNNFSNQIYFYLNKKQDNAYTIDQVVKLENKLEKDTYKSLIYPNLNITAVFVEVCSKNLTPEILNNNIKLTINEIIHPIILFVPNDQKTPSVNSVSYIKISPTKYIIETGMIERPSILVFSDRFSPGWELEIFDAKQMKFNGYANGWLIDKPGEYKLNLEYKPQQLFSYGVIVTVIVALVSFVILMIEKKPRGKI